MSKPLLFFVRVPTGDIVGNAENNDSEDLASHREIFDRLFMIKPDMTAEEKKASRAVLDAIHSEVHQRVACAQHPGSTSRVLDKEAMPAKRKLSDYSHTTLSSSKSVCPDPAAR